MAILKCKMCGGDIELSADKTFGTCDSCGSTMTFPKVDDEQRANMFNRGNHFRRTGEFDKALAVYERIVQEDENDAEAHWCCALCRFGIEYVEDPNTFEYLPTCHRASFDSFLEDVDYLAALDHSDGITRRQYQKDAAKIAEVQRGILATSQNEEPFDVFICYKESENDGTRTRDSLMAQEIYYQLTEQGRRVFFSRITLEDKAGTEYEPYIFAALNSAKVMIVVTTSAEHVNAVWVKNEWSRFLSLMRKDRSKLLLPCYRDMDPYDLPEALSVLQSYDMGKIGFIQDLIRGVNKVLDASKPKETVKETVVVQQTQQNNVAPLLKRAFMFLEDGDFTRADEFCEQVLNLDPENAEAYLGKLMAELKVRTRDTLKHQPEPFGNRNNYQKAVRFGDAALQKKLKDDITFIRERNETARKEGIYRQAIEKRNNKRYRDAIELFGRIAGFKDSDARKEECEQEMETDRKNTIYDTALALSRYDTVEKQREAIEKLRQIPGWKDADVQIGLCEQKIETIRINTENARKDGIYQQALSRMKDEAALTGSVSVVKKSPIERHKKAIELLRSIPGWRDAEAQIELCEQHIRELQAQAEHERIEAERKAEEDRIAAEKAAKKRTLTMAIVIPTVAACIAFVIVLFAVILPNQKYKAAVKLYENGEYEEAIAAFEALNGYKDSEAQIENCKTAMQDREYDAAVALCDEGKYEEAYTAFALMDGYRDSAAQMEACKTAIKDRDYDAAAALYDAGKYEDAIAAFKALDGYGDSLNLIHQCKYQIGIILFDEGKFEEAASSFIAAEGYKDSADMINESRYCQANNLCNEGDYSRAYTLFIALGKYKDSFQKAEEIRPQYIQSQIRSANIGAVVSFGSYEQDNNRANGKEPIEWYIIAKSGNKALLLAKNALEEGFYHNFPNDEKEDDEKEVTWETCFLRKRLNEQFLNDAFNDNENKMIVSSTLETVTNSGTIRTTDKVFLLSEKELKLYLDKDTIRCEATAYLKSKGVFVNNYNHCLWYLRDKYKYQSIQSIMGVNESDDGDILLQAFVVNNKGGGVGYCIRPAIWVNCE
ncbi:MAG: TIR domain-containing protein [Clostridia bacterium]|nr:TIR domain-containing protein [Clostridia bacterium]